MKGIFDAYVLWPFDKKFVFELVTCVNTRDYTVDKSTYSVVPAKLFDIPAPLIQRKKKARRNSISQKWSLKRSREIDYFVSQWHTVTNPCMIFLSLIFIYIVLKLFIFCGVPIFEIFMFCTAMDLDPILNCSLHVLKKNYILTDSNINTIDLKLQERKIIYANHLLQKKITSKFVASYG